MKSKSYTKEKIKRDVKEMPKIIPHGSWAGWLDTAVCPYDTINNEDYKKSVNEFCEDLEKQREFHRKREQNKSLDPHKSKEGKVKLCSRALHPTLHYPLVDVAELSLEKGYKPFNFLEEGKESTRVMYWVEAAQRHIDKYKMGFTLNKEEKKLDGTSTNIQPHHLAQAAYDLLCAILVENSEHGQDDRMFKEGKLK